MNNIHKVESVRIIVGQYAYACLSISCGGKFDVRLSPSKSPSQSLLEYAQEQRKRAQRAERQAQWAEQAAKILVSRGPTK